MLQRKQKGMPDWGRGCIFFVFRRKRWKQLRHTGPTIITEYAGPRRRQRQGLRSRPETTVNTYISVACQFSVINKPFPLVTDESLDVIITASAVSIKAGLASIKTQVPANPDYFSNEQMVSYVA